MHFLINWYVILIIRQIAILHIPLTEKEVFNSKIQLEIINTLIFFQGLFTELS